MNEISYCRICFNLFIVVCCYPCSEFWSLRDCLHLVVESLETFVVKDSETGNQKVIFLSRPILCSNETLSGHFQELGQISRSDSPNMRCLALSGIIYD